MTEILGVPVFEWIVFILMMFFHELGHGLLASFFGRTVRFSIRWRGPVTIHGLLEGEPSTPTNQLQIISSAGYFFNLLTVCIMVPLFEYDYVKYLAFCTVCSVRDFYTIYKRIKN